MGDLLAQRYSNWYIPVKKWSLEDHLIENVNLLGTNSHSIEMKYWKKQLEKVQCPLCQGWFSKNYLQIHLRTKRAHPEEEEWNLFNNVSCYWKDFSKCSSVSLTYFGVPMLWIIWFTTNGASAVWTSEWCFQFLLVAFAEVVWVKGFFVVCAVGLPSCVCLCGLFGGVRVVECF